MFNVAEELDNVIRLAQAAKAALADEHEGNLRAAVVELDDTSDAIRAQVESW